MKVQNCFLTVAAFAITACAERPGIEGNPFIEELPANVTEIAAANQDLQQVVLLPEDNCYWYNHAGPVETTLLPLRSKDGRPICVRAAEDSAS